ncbi:hypothetical protein Elgi_00870 [Paenibacillus elgii]|nr:hypothetical protein Elgi_00870 [Paenibacillus elgii]
MDETYFLFSEKDKRNIADCKQRKRGGKAKYRGISNHQVCVLVNASVGICFRAARIYVASKTR